MSRLRFGIARPDGEPGSSYWTVSPSTTERDVYIAERWSGRNMHVSLHRDDRWHIKILDPHREQPIWINYERPQPLAPGLTRALTLAAPGAWGQGEQTARTGVIWVIPDDLPNRQVELDLVIEDHEPKPDEWPGRDSMGTRLVGRLRLADGTTASVVSRCLEATAGSATVPTDLSADQVADLRRRILESRDPRGCLFGRLADGAILMKYGFLDRSSFRDAAAEPPRD
jgi:hypothetical protein